MNHQLADYLHSKIVSLSKLGDDLVAQGKSEEAKDKYIEALKLLPGDHREWEAATWLYVAIGDIHFLPRIMKKHLCAL